MQKLFAVDLLFVILLLLLFIYGGKSLECFECRTDVHDNCIGAVNKSFSVNCTVILPNATGLYCRVIKQKLKFKKDDDYTYIRECASEKGFNPCYYFKWTDIAFQETCECEIDLCNRGNTLLPSHRLFVLSFSLWMLMYLTKR